MKNIKEDNFLKYLNELKYPEIFKGVKMPTQISPPSCTYQLTYSLPLSLNDDGNCLISFNPFFLASKTAIGKVIKGVTINRTTGDEEVNYYMISKYLSSFIFNNNDLLTGENDYEDYVQISDQGIDISQTTPFDFYSQYRLVSACLKIKYVGDLNEVSGVIGGGISYEDKGTIGGRYYRVDSPGAQYDPDHITYPIAQKSKYRAFNNVRHLPFFREYPLLNGIRMIYYPVDKSFENFVKVYDSGHTEKTLTRFGETANPEFLVPEDYYQSGFTFVVFVQGGPRNKACIQADICCNFECLPNEEFLIYLKPKPSRCLISLAEKRKVWMLIKDQLIESLIKHEEEKKTIYLNLHK